MRKVFREKDLYKECLVNGPSRYPVRFLRRQLFINCFETPFIAPENKRKRRKGGWSSSSCSQRTRLSPNERDIREDAVPLGESFENEASAHCTVASPLKFSGRWGSQPTFRKRLLRTVRGRSARKPEAFWFQGEIERWSGGSFTLHNASSRFSHLPAAVSTRTR